MAARRPKLAVWKFASCDGCQLTLLDCEDELLAILDACIVPPTSQNLRSIEDDLRAIGPTLVDLPRAEATRRAEQTVRNHDPCISCSTHVIDLRMQPGCRR